MMRIATLNLNYYVEKHGPWDARKKLILEAFRRHDPDIIALQAVAGDARFADGRDQALQLCEGLPGFTHHYFEEAQVQPDGQRQGSAIIARLPMKKRAMRALAFEPGCDDANKRLILRASFDTSAGGLDLYNVHYSWVSGLAQRQVAQTAAWTTEGSSRFVVVGDMNTPPSDAATFSSFRPIGLGDAWMYLRGTEAGYTFESDNPSMRIDYFWVSQALQPEVSGVDIVSAPPESAVRFSDHHAMMLTLR